MFGNTKNTAYHAPDYLFIIGFGLLILFGLIMLSSAGTAVGFENYNDSYHFIKEQLLKGFLPGLLLLLILSKINYQYWKKFSLPFLIISVILLIVVFIPGIGATFGTARSWIQIFGFSIQPAEIVKLTFLLYLATWLEKRGAHGVKDLYNGFLPFIILIGIISALIMKQPDMGTLSIIIFMSLAVYFASGAKIKHVVGLVTVGGLGMYYLITNSAYREARFTTFLHPELDPQGIGYHINQAFLAVGSGGWFGRGFGHSRQKFLFLPETTGDSIFAVIGEELGFIVCLLLIALFVFLMIRGFKIGRNSIDQFGRLVTVGIISWLIFQAFFNIASMIGLLPMTGIPLPFISYGGTAMMIGMAAIGIVINISKQTKQHK